MADDRSGNPGVENKSGEQLVRELAEMRDQLAARESECYELSQKLESEARFRMLYERTPLSYQSLDEAGRFIEVNQTWLDVMGYSREEVIGRSFDEFLIPQTKPQFQERFSRFKAAGEILGVEFEMVKKDGSSILVSLDGKVGRDSRFNFQQTHCVLQDITTRKQMEDALLRSRQELAAELDAVKRLQRVIRGINLIFEQAIRSETEEALGKTCLDAALEVTGSQFGFVGETGGDGAFKEIAISDMGWDQCRIYDPAGHRRLPEDLILKGLFGQIINKHKSLFTNDLSTHPGSIGLPHGHPPIKCFLGVPLIHMGQTIGTLAVANRKDGYDHEQQKDLETLAPAVVEALFRKRAETALRESEQKFRIVFEQSAIGMGRVRFSDARWIDVNETFCRMLGYSRQEVLRTPWPQMTHPEDLDLDLIPFRRMAAGKLDHYSVEKRFIHKQGTFVWARLTLSLVRDAQGLPDHEIAIVENITERKRAEQALRQLTETLEGQVAERTQLAESRARQLQTLAVDLIEAEEKERQRIAGILHDDLQQLLAGARFQVQSSMNKKDPRHLLENVVRLLEESIGKSRRLSHELSPPVLHQFGLTAALQWLVRQMDEQFGLKIELEIWPVRQSITAPIEVFLFHAVQELMFNIVKHSGAQSALVVFSGSEKNIQIAISDQGRGFDPQILFSPDKRAGLGIASLRERAHAIGGHLAIDSAPGRGSRFTLTVPSSLEMLDSTIGAQGIEPQPKFFDPAITVMGSENIRVLFADDHRVMRQGLIGLIAGKPDIQVAGEAADGEEALEMARQLRPDVVVMDVSMPKMDGVEATRRIRTEMPGTRVIGLSMFDDEEVARKMRQAGAEAFVSKTASSAELLKAIYGIDGRKGNGGTP